jgi:hypothetical protein
MNTCPDCKCEFVQPFRCATCGAQKLYDHTVTSQQQTIDALRARIAELEYVAGLMWDRYEDGEPCYEGMTDDDTGTYTGQAVYFSDEETARCL